jgi:hypothetical protein
MVGLAASCWAIWQARNNTCFEKKRTRSPTESICSISSFLKYWAGLQKEERKAMLEAGAEVLKNAALLHHPRDQDQGGAKNRNSAAAVEKVLGRRKKKTDKTKLGEEDGKEQPPFGLEETFVFS